ncbi:uncharacterized protein LOC134688515 isoform X2 [Mytilus trossulus]|uniref:uncharacterized protein LOC134688515 isoform X2 n=1 Tax=Mytilus trossulus TaxID=6551 RepID=UPI00300432CA
MHLSNVSVLVILIFFWSLFNELCNQRSDLRQSHIVGNFRRRQNLTNKMSRRKRKRTVEKKIIFVLVSWIHVVLFKTETMQALYLKFLLRISFGRSIYITVFPTDRLQQNRNMNRWYYEGNRVFSFARAPVYGSFFIRLARLGFYYDEELHITKCAFCGAQYTDGNNPEVIHHHECQLEHENIPFGSTYSEVAVYKSPKYKEFESLESRKASFYGWPHLSNQSFTLELAEAGFFYTGNGDIVRCFSCGGCLQHWQQSENYPIPWIEHLMWFPHCDEETHSQYSETIEAMNMRVQATEVSQEEVAQLNFRRQIRRRNVSDNLLQTRNRALTYGQRETLISSEQTNSNILVLRSQQLDEMHRSVDRDHSVLEGEQSTPAQIDMADDLDNTLDRPRHPAYAQLSLRPPKEVNSATSQPPVDRDHSVLEGEQSTPAQRDMAEDLGITTDRPRYPAFSNLSVRISTFRGWPGYLDQAPRDMALAGFFYAGYNDNCTSGLRIRNWDESDDPCVEHLRWFSNSSFDRQNRGQRWFETIGKKKQKEMPPKEVHSATSQPPVDRDHSVLEGEQSTPAHRDMAEDLGITIDRPRYPAYSNLSVRISTFQGWPGYLDQAPRDTALAGFFYAAEGLHDENNQMERSCSSCFICRKKKKSIIFKPCGHILCCKDCAFQHSFKKCMQCGKKIQKFKNVFLP